MTAARRGWGGSPLAPDRVTPAGTARGKGGVVEPAAHGLLGVVLRRVGRWLGIDVLASVAPLGIAALVRWARGDEVTLEALLGDGELLLVTIGLTLPVLAAVVMSELTPGSRYALSILLLGTLVPAGILYGSFASQEAANTDDVVSYSLVLWVVLLVAAAIATAAIPRTAR